MIRYASVLLNKETAFKVLVKCLRPGPADVSVHGNILVHLPKKKRKKMCEIHSTKLYTIINIMPVRYVFSKKKSTEFNASI